MSDQQLAGALGRDNLHAIDLDTEPIAVLEDRGYDVAIAEVIPVWSKKAGEDNSAYLVVQAALDTLDGPKTVFLCHCWDFVVRQFPDRDELTEGDLTGLDDCKHIEQAKRFQGDDGLRAAENEGLGQFVDDRS